ncbi:MAG: hypothetical protein U9R34_05620 [Nanoarchaeota archaeon]|nr:hypothetical protein [Nanoarchaeota archaeon]
MKQKGQITFFIIIGLVLIAIFLIMFTMISQTREKEAEIEVEESRQIPADIMQLQDFAQSCVALTVNQAFFKFGRSGGTLFDVDGGLIPLSLEVQGEDYQYIEAEQANIAYTIKKSLKEDTGFYKIYMPEYPFHSFPSMSINHPHILQGFYGYVKFPSLESLSDPANPITIKEQLKNYIENNIKICTRGFENFANLEVSEGDITANITFHDKSTVVDINYPLDIRKKATNDVTRIEDFIVRIPLRMHNLHVFARMILDAECLMIDNSPFGKQYGSARIAGIMRDIGPSGFDDIIMIEDSSYLIDGSPFRLNLLIANRPPALHYIDSLELPNLKVGDSIIGNDEDLLIVQSGSNVIYNFSDKIKNWLEPYGKHRIYYEPDGDNVSIEYVPQLPYLIIDEDQWVGTKEITIKISDGEYTDWQTITFNIAN